MANMSYCRFENTLSDLRDCQEALEDEGLTNEDDSRTEAMSRKELVALCREISREWGEE
jgi:hypothetical protein